MLKSTIKKDKLYAYIKTFNAGYECERKSVSEKFESDVRYLVKSVAIGRSSTDVIIYDKYGFEENINEAFLGFEYNGLPYDIWKNPLKLDFVYPTYVFMKIGEPFPKWGVQPND